MGAVLPFLTARFPAFGKAVYEAGKEYRALHAGARRIAFYHGSTESLVGFVLNSSLKEFGDIYVSALTVLQTSMQFASVPLTGFAQGLFR